jgi:hypothetical protein
LVVLFLLMLVPSVGLGYRGHYKWWRQPKAKPLPKHVVFDDVTTKRADCLVIQKSRYKVVSKKRIKFKDNPYLSAAVADGILYFEPFEIYGETYEGVAKIAFIFDEARLKKKSYFGSRFHTYGVALVGDEFEVPVKMSGSIDEHGGYFRLKAHIVGRRCETVETNVSHKGHASYKPHRAYRYKGHRANKVIRSCKVIRLSLKGTGAEAEPEPEPEPNPEPEPEPGGPI